MLQKLDEFLKFEDLALKENQLLVIKGSGQTKDECREYYATGNGMDEQQYLYFDGELQCSRFVLLEC